MTYDDWLERETEYWFGYDRDNDDDAAEPDLTVCTDCGFFIREGEAGHHQGQCQPWAEPAPRPELERIICDHCGGTGTHPNDRLSMCPVCPGTGTIFAMDWRTR